MTYTELSNLKNGTTIKITWASTRFEIVLLDKYYLRDYYNQEPCYLWNGEKIPVSLIKVATKKDIEKYIEMKQRQLDFMKQMLEDGLHENINNNI